MKTRTRAAIIASLASLSLTSIAAATPGVPWNGAVSVGQFFSPANGGSSAVGLTGDGRFAVYTSDASNLVDGDNNGNQDVFLYDRLFLRTLLMSISTSGGSGNGLSGSIAQHSRIITDDARYVLFTSNASDLVGNDTNGASDGFLRDTSGFGATIRVTLGSGGGQIAGSSTALGMSADANRILFATSASLSPKDANTTSDLYLYERSTQQTTLISCDAGGTALGNVEMGTIADNGRNFAFTTTASLVPTDTNGLSDVYWKDTGTNTFRVVSATAANVVGDRRSYDPAISADGATVAFRTQATNLVAGDTNLNEDIYAKRLVDNSIVRVSTKTGGGEVAFPACLTPKLSANGNIAVLTCSAPDLVVGDTNGQLDVFTKDMITGNTTRVSVSQNGAEGKLPSYNGSPNADGSLILFTSLSALYSTDTNGLSDAMTATRL